MHRLIEKLIRSWRQRELQNLLTAIETLSDKGCTDIEAIEIATDLLKVEYLKERFGQQLNNELLNEAIQATKEVSDQGQQMLRMLGTLSDREKQCYFMHYIGSRSMGNIAKELKVSKGAVQQYIERARNKLEVH